MADSASTDALGVQATANQQRAASVWIILLLFVWAGACSMRGQQPPPARGADAAPQVFSAQRALLVLRRVLPDATPHPVGSVANAHVRDRILREFTRIGLTASVRSRLACSASLCARVDNILARLPGRSPNQTVLASAHYDSVAAGPGVSDDGAGVAALLESARALKAGPRLERDVWFLVSDGEEAGLLGARAFSEEPEFARIASVVNLEARGTSGASRLIETGANDTSVIAALRQVLTQPAGTSLDHEIYKALPNKTDFTVYAERGLRGANFAWAQGPARYHTPVDDLVHVDPHSLQQHGDNMLAAIRAFAKMPANRPAQDDAVYFGIFGSKLFAWPVRWNWPWLATALCVSVLAFLRHRRSMRIPMGSVLVFSWVLMVAPLLAGLTAWPLMRVLQRIGALPAQWTAQAAWLIAAFLLLALALMTLLACVARRYADPASLAFATWVPLGALSVAASLRMPGAIYIALLPWSAGAIAALLAPRRPLLWSTATATVAAALCTPYALLLHSAMGNAMLPAVAAVGMFTLMPLLPVLASHRPTVRALGGTATVAAIVCLVVAAIRPPFNRDIPQPLNLLLAGSASGACLYASNGIRLPDELRSAGFNPNSQTPLPWSQNAMWPGPGAPAIAGPVIQASTWQRPNAGRQVRLLVQSRREATAVTVVLPSAVPHRSIGVMDRPLAVSSTALSASSSAWRAITLIGIPASGMRIEYTLPAQAPADVYAYDTSPGIATRFAMASAARNRIATPIHGGDLTLAWSRARLDPPH